MTDRTRSAYDRFAERYDLDENPLITLEHEDVVAAVAAQKDDRILEAACGTGRYIAEWLKRGAEVHGFDFSDGMLRCARERFPSVDLRKADLTYALPYEDDEFGIANCAQALKHVEDLGYALGELGRVVRPGGRVVFSVTHPEMTWDSFEMSSEPTFIIGAQTDVFHHAQSDYEDAARLAGLRIDAVKAVTIDARIKRLLSARSYEATKGRRMVEIFTLSKPS